MGATKFRFRLQSALVVLTLVALWLGVSRTDSPALSLAALMTTIAAGYRYRSPLKILPTAHVPDTFAWIFGLGVLSFLAAILWLIAYLANLGFPWWSQLNSLI